MRPFSLKNFRRRFSLRRGMFFWYQHYKVLFFIGFLAVLGLGGFYWYDTLYQYHWSDQRKQEFIATHFKATTFKEQAFDRLVTDLKERSRRYEEPVPLTRDIFSGTSL